MTTESLPAAVEPAAMTKALRRCGVLGDAAVRNVAVESSRATIVSRIIRLRVEYDGDAGGAPETMILKMGLPRSDGGIGLSCQREITFYAEIAALTPERLIPKCFDAHWDADRGAGHILMEDLTDTHDLPTTWPLPPTVPQCERILAARARFHAAWWDDPRLGTAIGVRHDDTTAAAYVNARTAEFTRFADLLGERLSKERRDIYERFLGAAPRLLGRHRSHRNVTIAQGDSHVWNTFLPRDGGDDVRLFDWENWSVNLGTNDLAYMMSTHWYPERRRRVEQPLLDHYHRVLLEHGVQGYGRDDLREDYRLSALMQIVIPVLQAAHEIPPIIWWGHLERVMLAFDDLGCGDLL
jgi:hypothetical protein